MNKFEVTEQIEFEQFQDNVMDYLEWIGYPEYVAGFDALAISKAISKTSAIFFLFGQSARITALTIFGMTYHYQIALPNQNLPKSKIN